MHEAAFLGGPHLRGYRKERFAGRSSVFGNAEVRLQVLKVGRPEGVKIGVLGFTDSWRVFFDNQRSNRWHSSMGGGLWATTAAESRLVSVTVARSPEGSSVYVRAGFPF
ncbi:MAG: hypothetical protein HY700_14835 [Gemmatimonadetes bacterium]|nr:hypothetical protein [Gemmatimonadota bacterium]